MSKTQKTKETPRQSREYPDFPEEAEKALIDKRCGLFESTTEALGYADRMMREIAPELWACSLRTCSRCVNSGCSREEAFVVLAEYLLIEATKEALKTTASRVYGVSCKDLHIKIPPIVKKASKRKTAKKED
ncbi:MAG: hypothetical protein K6F50_06205 [Kiritimatiellae bacterium]|nr:hypothetical protein [Kiritimatiellia bacterium]